MSLKTFAEVESLNRHYDNDFNRETLLGTFERKAPAHKYCHFCLNIVIFHKLDRTSKVHLRQHYTECRAINAFYQKEWPAEDFQLIRKVVTNNDTSTKCVKLFELNVLVDLRTYYLIYLLD